MVAFPSLNFGAVTTAGGLAKLGQIIVGDLTMAGDNVVIMGSLASGLPEKDRRRVLLLGVGMALVFLITFAVVATQLLKVTGLVFAGGLLLLWVAYNMWTELHPRQPVVSDDPDTAEVEGPPRTKTFLQAAIQIMIADLSMSLDNVLLVASIAREGATDAPPLQAPCGVTTGRGRVRNTEAEVGQSWKLSSKRPPLIA